MTPMKEYAIDGGGKLTVEGDSIEMDDVLARRILEDADSVEAVMPDVVPEVMRQAGCLRTFARAVVYGPEVKHDWLTKEEEWPTAVHEAAHAVVGVLLGARLQEARMIPPVWVAWEDGCDSTPAAVDAAGSVAESRIRGEKLEVYGTDLDILQKKGADVSEAEATASVLLDAYWRSVEKVAERLLEEGVLDHNAVVQVIDATERAPGKAPETG